MKNDLHSSFVLQQDQRDCGIACLLSIIRYYGGDDNFENLRNLSGTNNTGTTLLGLYQAAKQTGFDADGCEADITALLEHADPCILHVSLEHNRQHYMVCYGSKLVKNKQQFIIGDPARGIIYMSPEDVSSIWKSKTCLTLTANSKFQHKKAVTAAKRTWLKAVLEQDLPLLLVAATLGIAIAALGLTMTLYSQRLIDDILPNKLYTKLTVGIVMILLLLLAKEGIVFLRGYLLLRQATGFNTRIINQFYKQLLQLPKPFFDTRKIGELTARLNDTSRIQRVISQIAGNLLLDATVVLVTLCFIFYYSVSVGFLTLAVLPFFFLLIYLNNKKIANSQYLIMGSYAQAEANYISTLQGIEAIRNHNKEGLFETSNNHIYINYQSNLFKLGVIQIRLSVVANAFATFFLCCLLLFLSNQVFKGNLKAGELMAITGMVASLLPSVANLAMLTIPLNEAKVAFNRMYEFVSLTEKEKDDAVTIQSVEKLQIKNLFFRFAGRSPILNNISFEVAKGEIVAIMGENGCGKSTLTQVLLQNYLPESGSIFVNNKTSLATIDKVNWRSMVATVPQQIHIFNGTILENIAFDDAFNNQQKVIDFLTGTGLYSFLDCFPHSYLTLVGEEGINLSGGQKQMIAIARALYNQPQLLILDEATSAMDRESEQRVLQLLQNMKQSMSIIFITHKLHLLKSFCDRIYVMEKGTITIAGNHENLLETKNLYSSYWADLMN